VLAIVPVINLVSDLRDSAGVPFYLRTGKALAKQVTEVTIQYRRPPLRLFEHAPHPGHQPGDEIEPNRLTLRIQPDEGISLRVGLKPPGPRISLVPARLGFAYRDTFGVDPAEAYERLLLDCMLGDSTLFIRRDEVETAWRTTRRGTGARPRPIGSFRRPDAPG